MTAAAQYSGATRASGGVLVAGAPPPKTGRRNGRGHIDALDLARAVTAIGVIATHTTEALAGAHVGSTLALAGLHATRHIFFLISALVLVHAHYDDERFATLAFWGRRARHVLLPYLAWSVVYWAVSGTTLTGLDITPRPVPSSVGAALHQLSALVLTGTGHLYFIVVLAQFYVVFPLFLWLLRRTHRWHLVLLAASLGLQIVLDEGVHHGTLPAVFLGTSGNRQILLYQFYLVAGGIVGARSRQVMAWVWRHRLPVALACAAVCVGIELEGFVELHRGVPIGVVGDPFAPIYIAFNVGAFVLVVIAGMAWARSRRQWIQRPIRAASAHSYGVYLLHPLFLDVFTVAFFAPMIAAGESRTGVIVLAVAVVFAAALSASTVLSRVPFASRLVDRATLGLRRTGPTVGRT